MAINKVYPFIRAKMFDLEGNNNRKDVLFDGNLTSSTPVWIIHSEIRLSECPNQYKERVRGARLSGGIHKCK